MPSKIIGTGLTSMVGSRFVELYQDDFEFINLDLATGIDITDEISVKKAIGESRGEVVVHFAAFTDVDKAHQQNGDITGLCYKINVLGTRKVAQSCKATEKYLIHISTDFVFDGENPPPGGYTEDNSPHPIEWYGQTKFWAEQEVENSGAKHVIVRITYPYRANFPQKLDLIRKIIAKLKDKQTVNAFTDHIITPTFIDDIATVLKVIIDKRPHGVYHLAGSSHVSDYAIATTVAEVFKLDKSLIRPTSLEEFLTTAHRPYQKNLSTSNAKLARDFDISMSTLEEGLQKIKQQLTLLQ